MVVILVFFYDLIELLFKGYGFMPTEQETSQNYKSLKLDLFFSGKAWSYQALSLCLTNSVFILDDTIMVLEEDFIFDLFIPGFPIIVEKGEGVGPYEDSHLEQLEEEIIGMTEKRKYNLEFGCVQSDLHPAILW